MGKFSTVAASAVVAASLVGTSNAAVFTTDSGKVGAATLTFANGEWTASENIVMHQGYSCADAKVDLGTLAQGAATALNGITTFADLAGRVATVGGACQRFIPDGDQFLGAPVQDYSQSKRAAMLVTQLGKTVGKVGLSFSDAGEDVPYVGFSGKVAGIPAGAQYTVQIASGLCADPAPVEGSFVTVAAEQFVVFGNDGTDISQGKIEYAATGKSFADLRAAGDVRVIFADNSDDPAAALCGEVVFQSEVRGYVGVSASETAGTQFQGRVEGLKPNTNWAYTVRVASDDADAPTNYPHCGLPQTIGSVYKGIQPLTVDNVANQDLGRVGENLWRNGDTDVLTFTSDANGVGTIASTLAVGAKYTNAHLKNFAIVFAISSENPEYSINLGCANIGGTAPEETPLPDVNAPLGIYSNGVSVAPAMGMMVAMLFATFGYLV